MPKSTTKRKPSRSHTANSNIVIDKEGGLIFSSEDQLYGHFAPDIKKLEDDFFSRRAEDDIGIETFPDYEEMLSRVLEDPDEIWEDTSLLPNQNVYIYIGHFQSAEDQDVWYAALTYVTGDTPTFVYLHFPTAKRELIDRYRQGDLIYNRVLKELQKGAIEGDALTEGDELAAGLYQSMLTVRSDKDIPESEFHEYAELREESIEDADEIWRSTDLSSNVLVSFIREFPDFKGNDVFYVVVTIEDPASASHALLFSFPTIDKSLVERYRHGENLQAEEVIQEASH